MAKKTDYKKMWRKEKVAHNKTFGKLTTANDIIDVQADIIKKISKKNRKFKLEEAKRKLEEHDKQKSNKR